MRILVTGAPGCGKTTLVQYAHSREDKRFVDADEVPDLCEWREFKSGKSIGLVSDYEKNQDDSWYKRNGWYWRKKALKKLLVEKEDVFLCGSSENMNECYKYFDKIYFLRKTEEELTSNLVSPDRQNPFGKTPEQRKGFIKWQNFIINAAKSYPHTILDGNEIDTIYDSIINDKEL